MINIKEFNLTQQKHMLLLILLFVCLVLSACATSLGDDDDKNDDTEAEPIQEAIVVFPIIPEELFLSANTSSSASTSNGYKIIPEIDVEDIYVVKIDADGLITEDLTDEVEIEVQRDLFSNPTQFDIYGDLPAGLDTLILADATLTATVSVGSPVPDGVLYSPVYARANIFSSIQIQIDPASTVVMNNYLNTTTNIDNDSLNDISEVITKRRNDSVPSPNKSVSEATFSQWIDALTALTGEQYFQDFRAIAEPGPLQSINLEGDYLSFRSSNTLLTGASGNSAKMLRAHGELHFDIQAVGLSGLLPNYRAQNLSDDDGESILALAFSAGTATHVQKQTDNNNGYTATSKNELEEFDFLSFASSSEILAGTELAGEEIFYDAMIITGKGTTAITDTGAFISSSVHASCELANLNDPPSNCAFASTNDINARGLSNATQIFIPLETDGLAYDFNALLGDYGVFQNTFLVSNNSPISFTEALSLHRLSFSAGTPGAASNISGGDTFSAVYSQVIGDPLNNNTQNLVPSFTATSQTLPSLTLSSQVLSGGETTFTSSEYPNSTGAATPSTGLFAQLNYHGDAGNPEIGEMQLIKLPVSLSDTDLDDKQYFINGTLTIVEPDNTINRCHAEGVLSFDTDNSQDGSALLINLDCLDAKPTSALRGAPLDTTLDTTTSIAQSVAIAPTNPNLTSSDGSLAFTISDPLTFINGENLSIALTANVEASGYVQEGTNLIMLAISGDGRATDTASVYGLLYATLSSF